MPLDGTTIYRTQCPVYRGTLRDVADDLGIVPLSKAVLLAHKNAELKKHPGSLLFHYRGMAQNIIAIAFLIGLFGTCAAVFGLALMLMCGSPLWISVMVSGMLCSACLCISSMAVMIFAVVKEPARWVEGIPDTLDSIPTQLVAIAMAIKRNHVGSYLVVGKLIQNRILLDPYLLVQTRTGDEIVIGIWDDGKIIASATRQ